MRRKADYVPKYSLSTKYLRLILTKKEFDMLLKNYIKAKLSTWRNKMR